MRGGGEEGGGQIMKFQVALPSVWVSLSFCRSREKKIGERREKGKKEEEKEKEEEEARILS